MDALTGFTVFCKEREKLGDTLIGKIGRYFVGYVINKPERPNHYVVIEEQPDKREWPVILETRSRKEACGFAWKKASEVMSLFVE